MALSFGFGSSGSKNHSYIDGKTSDAQWANYGGAQGLLGSYTPTSASQIQSYMNPYVDNVVNKSLGALDQSRQMAINSVGDHAAGMNAFGGSRQGVAEGITNGQYAQQAGLLSSNLYNQGYGQALQTAQGENQYGYQYPLARQGLLNQTLQGITPQTFSKGKQTGFNIGWDGSGGSSGGGGGGGSDGGDLLKYFFGG